MACGWEFSVLKFVRVLKKLNLPHFKSFDLFTFLTDSEIIEQLLLWSLMKSANESE